MSENPYDKFGGTFGFKKDQAVPDSRNLNDSDFARQLHLEEEKEFVSYAQQISQQRHDDRKFAEYLLSLDAADRAEAKRKRVAELKAISQTDEQIAERMERIELERKAKEEEEKQKICQGDIAIAKILAEEEEKEKSFSLNQATLGDSDFCLALQAQDEIKINSNSNSNKSLPSSDYAQSSGSLSDSDFAQFLAHQDVRVEHTEPTLSDSSIARIMSQATAPGQISPNVVLSESLLKALQQDDRPAQPSSTGSTLSDSEFCRVLQQEELAAVGGQTKSQPSSTLSDSEFCRVLQQEEESRFGGPSQSTLSDSTLCRILQEQP